MKLKELVTNLKRFNQEANIVLGSDEELNICYKDIEISYLDNNNKVVIFGLSGSEDE